jgi:penicillin amidase
MPINLTSHLPRTGGRVSLAGLSLPAEIYRDAWGIPHARAGGETDACYVQGFFTAQDRLWQMEYDRRRGSGRWAEVVGKAALDQDVMMRRFRLVDSAQADYGAVNDRTRKLMDAYAAGVNAWIETAASEGTLPVEYSITDLEPETWRPWDGLVVFKARHILMGVFESKTWRAQMVRELGPERAGLLAPGYQPGQLQILPPGSRYAGELDYYLAELMAGATAVNLLKETDSGSNSWALAGDRTASGKPLLAGDSHRALDTPNVYYQCHVACPEWDVIGLAIPGVPGFPHFGHNDKVAWCITHLSADYQDLFIEEFNDAGLYRLPDLPDDADSGLTDCQASQWGSADVREETIPVRDGEAHHITTWATRHGPIIAGGPPGKYGLALKYTATDGPKSWPNIIPAMLRAQDSHQLADSMRGWVDPANNFLFADGDGNIGYLSRGEIPIRSGQNARLPVPGWKNDYEWQGNIPFAEMPRSINPPEGYIVTANNKPVDDDYPYYISSEFTPGFRAERVREALLALDKPTAADMAKVHNERTSIPALAYIEYLNAHSVEIQTYNSMAAKARKILLGWSGRMDAGDVAPTIYSAFRDALLHAIYRHNLGEELTREAWNPANRGTGAFMARVRTQLIYAFPEDDRRLLPEGETWVSMMAAALAEAVETLRHTLGDELAEWNWDRIHQARPRHTLSDAFPDLADLLDPPSIPMSGDGDTPLAGAYSPADLATVGSLSVARYAYDLADWDNSLWAIPLGASGNPGSPHYHDQSETWRQVQMIPMEYGWEGIVARSRSHQTLEPA